MRVARLLVLAAVAGATAVLLPFHGLTSPKPAFAKATQTCGRVEYQSGLEAVFGRRATHQQAITYRNAVVARGFVNAFIVNDCPSGFRIVVRGVETFDIGVDLQSEARKEGFPVTLECIQGKIVGRIEAIFGHGRDRVAANAIVTRAAAAGFPGLKMRPDPCGGFEVYLGGFKDEAEANAFKVQANARGFNVAIETT